MGGTPDRRYNLSFIVGNSVTIGKPIIGVSIAYRLSGYGFLDGQAIRAANVTNLGTRDQYLALQWLQENIAAFGGDPTKVTIWGESAGGESVGNLLTLRGGRDDKLFRGAISESGTPILQGGKYNESIGQAKYDNITEATGCANSSDTLACLRSVSFDTLNKALNITPAYIFSPYIDGDIIEGSIYEQLLKGNFVKVPYLLGANTDEGSAFGPQGINNDTAFEAYLNSTGADYESVRTLEALYPNIPALGVLDTVPSVTNTTYGTQFKRAAAFGGDLAFIAARRLTCQQWAKYNTSAFSYRFNVIVNPLPPIIGATHFQEVAFVFYNTQGLGYAVNPFEGEPPSFIQLSHLMTSMWAAFVHDGNPNGHGQVGIPEWPVYDDGAGGYGQNFVFDANVTSHLEPDTFRGAAIAYLNTLWGSQLGK
jgi:carboxylesterase type B